MNKLLLVLSVLFSVSANAQNIFQEKVLTILSDLASDEIKGREIGTPENMTGDEFSDLDELTNSEAQDQLKIKADPYLDHNLFYRSDNVVFARKKIVAHSFSTVDMRVAKHYHQLNDDMGVVNFENLRD